MTEFQPASRELSFSATMVTRTADAQLVLVRSDSVRPKVVADLSLGSWTVQSLSTQILGQILGRELAYKPKEINASASLSLGDAMSAGIDHEARGNSTILTAFDTAKKIIAVASKYGYEIFIVVGERTPAWRHEDQLLIEYLRTLDDSIDIRFVVFGRHAPAWPSGWRVNCDTASPPLEPTVDGGLLSRLPSAIPPSILKHCGPAEIETLILLANGWAILRPELRIASAALAVRFSRSEIAAMSTNAMHRFAVYATFHSVREAADCWGFCREAWRQFDIGYRELAFTYMDAALGSIATESDREMLVCHLQAMRVAAARYREAASIETSASSSTQISRSFILETKGWGAVMSNSPQEARAYLSEAMALSADETHLVPHLFLLNIKALAELRCGDHNAAYTLERQIESTIAQHAIGDARLRFINSINLARLLRYSGKFDEANRYYDLAFSTAEGGRSESDQVNANLSKARVEEASGNTKKAFLCWLRAAMHWIASECPESLGWRVQGLVLGKAMPAVAGCLGDLTLVVERIAAEFLKALKRYDQELLKGGPPPVAAGQIHVCGFTTSERAGALVTATRCIGAPGWSVVGTTVNTRMRTYGPHYEALIHWLCGWVQQMGYCGEHGYVVDVSNGTDMPTDLAGALCSALEFDAGNVMFDGIEYPLDQRTVQTMKGERQLAISPIVANISIKADATFVHFRRYFPPYQLTTDEKQVLQAIGSGATVRALHAGLESTSFASGRIADTVRSLRKKRVIRLSGPVRAMNVS